MVEKIHTLDDETDAFDFENFVKNAISKYKHYLQYNHGTMRKNTNNIIKKELDFVALTSKINCLGALFANSSTTESMS